MNMQKGLYAALVVILGFAACRAEARQPRELKCVRAEVPDLERSLELAASELKKIKKPQKHWKSDSKCPKPRPGILHRAHCQGIEVEIPVNDARVKEYERAIEDLRACLARAKSG